MVVLSFVPAEDSCGDRGLLRRCGGNLELESGRGVGWDAVVKISSVALGTAY